MRKKRLGKNVTIKPYRRRLDYKVKGKKGKKPKKGTTPPYVITTRR